MGIRSKVVRALGVAVAAGGASLGGTAEADAQQCNRWNAGADHCYILMGETYNGSNCPALTDFSFEEQRRYHTQWNLIKGSATSVSAKNLACAHHWEAYGYNGDSYFKADGLCYITCDSNSNPYPNAQPCEDGQELGGFPDITYGAVTREPECNRTPNGPYAHLGTSGVAGRAFDESVKDLIRAANTPFGFAYLSDVRAVNWPGGPGGKLDVASLVYNKSYGVLDDNDGPSMVPPFDPVPTTVDNYVNIDHIIPRKDIHGCDCGPNSPANALVISRKLNMEMSNNIRTMTTPANAAAAAKRQYVILNNTLP